MPQYNLDQIDPLTSGVLATAMGFKPYKLNLFFIFLLTFCVQAFGNEEKPAPPSACEDTLQVDLPTRYKQIIKRHTSTHSLSGASIAQKLILQGLEQKLRQAGHSQENLDQLRQAASEELRLESEQSAVAAQQMEALIAPLTEEEEARIKQLSSTFQTEVLVQALNETNLAAKVRIAAAARLMELAPRAQSTEDKKYALISHIRSFFKDLDDTTFLELLGTVYQKDSIETFAVPERLSRPTYFYRPVPVERGSMSSLTENSTQVTMTPNKADYLSLNYFMPIWSLKLKRLYFLSRLLGDTCLLQLSRLLENQANVDFLQKRQYNAAENPQVFGEEIDAAWELIHRKGNHFEELGSELAVFAVPLKVESEQLLQTVIKQEVEKYPQSQLINFWFKKWNYDLANAQAWLIKGDGAPQVEFLVEVHRLAPQLARVLTRMASADVRRVVGNELRHTGFFSQVERLWQQNLLSPGENAERATAQKILVVEDNRFRLQITRLLIGDVHELSLRDKNSNQSWVFPVYEFIHSTIRDGEKTHHVSYRRLWFGSNDLGFSQIDIELENNDEAFNALLEGRKLDGQTVDVIIKGVMYDQVTEPLLQHLTNWVNPSPGHVSLFTKGKVATGKLQ